MLTNKRTTCILLDKAVGEDLALLKEIETLNKTTTVCELYPMLYELCRLLNKEVLGEE